MLLIGLETAHNLLVDYLWDQGYEQVCVLSPSVVNSAQKRYHQSGAKDDVWDAHLIADLLRTDQGRYVPWKPDHPERKILSLLAKSPRVRTGGIYCSGAIVV